MNIGHGRLDWSDRRAISPERADEFKRFEMCLGDLVVPLDRPLISTGLKWAVVVEDDLPALLLQRVARFMPEESVVASRSFSSGFSLHSSWTASTLDGASLFRTSQRKNLLLYRFCSRRLPSRRGSLRSSKDTCPASTSLWRLRMGLRNGRGRCVVRCCMLRSLGS